MRIIFALLSLVFLALPHDARAQSVAPDRIQKGNKMLISVPVIVSDQEGRYISGLKKDDFTLFENDVEQKIAYFSTYDEPINIALMIDTSGSTKESLKDIKDAAGDFVDLLNRNDKCLVATFDAEIKILNALTSDQKIIKESLAIVAPAQKEGTVLLNAVQQIAQNSFTDVPGRKVIVLLSDGKDFGSSLTRNQLLSQLEESDVAIYSIFYQTGVGFNKIEVAPDGTIKEGKESKKNEKKKPQKKKKNYSILIPLRGDVFTEEELKLSAKVADIEAVNSLRALSDTTAGRFYQSDTPNLSGVFKRIAGELRQQYQLGYEARDAANDAGTRDIIVKVNRPDAVVRARGKFRAKQL
jgi:VWFA-related protein